MAAPDQDIRNVSATVAEPLHYIMGTHAYVMRNSIAARLHALSEEPPYKNSYLPVDMFLTQMARCAAFLWNSSCT